MPNLHAVHLPLEMTTSVKRTPLLLLAAAVCCLLFLGRCCESVQVVESEGKTDHGLMHFAYSENRLMRLGTVTGMIYTVDMNHGSKEMGTISLLPFTDKSDACTEYATWAIQQPSWMS